MKWQTLETYCLVNLKLTCCFKYLNSFFHSSLLVSDNDDDNPALVEHVQIDDNPALVEHVQVDDNDHQEVDALQYNILDGK